MASLWIRSGYDMKVEVSAETHQEGAHFKALIKAILVALLKSFERFFRISIFTSYPDLIQRLAIKGIWDVSSDTSSGGSF